MKYVGSYKGMGLVTGTATEYWTKISDEDRLDAGRMYLIENEVIYQGQVIAKVIGGYIEEVRPYKYARPAKYEPKVNIGFAYEPPKAELTPTKGPAQRGLRAHTNILDEECPGCEVLTSKTVDEYLASKKSVDYFLEEIKKEASSN